MKRIILIAAIVSLTGCASYYENGQVKRQPAADATRGMLATGAAECFRREKPPAEPMSFEGMNKEAQIAWAVGANMVALLEAANPSNPTHKCAQAQVAFEGTQKVKSTNRTKLWKSAIVGAGVIYGGGKLLDLFAAAGSTTINMGGAKNTNSTKGGIDLFGDGGSGTPSTTQTATSNDSFQGVTVNTGDQNRISTPYNQTNTTTTGLPVNPITFSDTSFSESGSGVDAAVDSSSGTTTSSDSSASTTE